MIGSQGKTGTAGALDGRRVLDLTHVLAGPFCTYQLALMGAEVIKIENPSAPDCARGRGPDDGGNADGLGLTYQVQGANKRSLALDLRRPEGAELLRALAREADVLVENYTTGALDALGLGPGHLMADNPGLIHCTITGYGDSGPQAGHGAYDNVIQATSGTIAQCGGTKPGVSFIDYATGYAAAFAVTAALAGRARSGGGSRISVSMLEVAMQMMAPEAAAAQHPDPALRPREAGIASYDTAEGRLMLGAFHPAQYRRLGALLEELGHPLPALAALQDWPDIWALDEATRAGLRAAFLTADAETWVARLRAADLPAERVRSLAEAVALPQLAARGFYQPSPADGATPLPGAAFHIDGSAPRLREAPPRLGQHTRSILAEMGLDAGRIADLYRSGVVA